MTNQDLKELLSKLGIAFSNDQESRTLTVLRSVLSATAENGATCSFGEIYKHLSEGEHDLKVTKAWVHRILKTLVDNQLIRLESPDATRKKYIGNIQTVTTGLEVLKEIRETEIAMEMKNLQEQIDSLGKADWIVHAENLVEELTGQKQTMTSRFFRGIKELQRVLMNNIHNPAGPGDIIRMTMMWLGSFGPGMDDRSIKYFDSAKNGAEIRMMVSLEMLMGDSAENEITLKVGLSMLQSMTELYAQGLKVDIRVQTGPPTYNATILNNDCIAMIISDYPMTGTFVTGEFNQDLIDDAVNAFDSHWEKALSLVNPDMELLKNSDIMESEFIIKVFKSFYPNFPDE